MRGAANTGVVPGARRSREPGTQPQGGVVARAGNSGSSSNASLRQWVPDRRAAVRRLSGTTPVFAALTLRFCNLAAHVISQPVHIRN